MDYADQAGRVKGKRKFLNQQIRKMNHEIHQLKANQTLLERKERSMKMLQLRQLEQAPAWPGQHLEINPLPTMAV